MTEWLRSDVHLEVVTGLAFVAGIYLLAIGPLHRRYGGAYRISPWRVAAFLGGLGMILVALNGPLHDLAERSLVSAHMLQHLLLMFVMPPLLLVGTPGWALRPILAVPGVRRIGAALTRPVPALSVASIVLALWHLPRLYDQALNAHEVHIFQHLSLMAAGVLLWWPVLGPLPEWPRQAPPAQLLYLFVAGIPMVPVGAFLTLAEDVLYPFYGDAPARWGLSPLADQRLGGVLMWVGVPLVFLAAMTIVFFRRMARDVEPADAPRERGAHGTP